MPFVRKSFYVLRHGQSTDNLAGLISGGGSDPDLTEEGIAQAKKAALLLKALEIKPDRIITSCLKRAKDTARFLNAHAEFLEDADLNERHLGELDGKISEAEQKILKILPGEEAGESHAARVIASVRKHIEAHEIPLFVCHGGTIRRILEALDLKGQVEVENARIYKFEFSGSCWKVSSLSEA